MLDKFRQNYNLSKHVVRILFVSGYMFCTWQKYLASTIALLQTTNLPIALFTSALVAFIMSILIPLLAGFLLNWCKFYNVPSAEYGLVALLFCAIGFWVNGLLNLINLFTPVFLVWGRVLFPFVVSTLCALWFFKVTADMYFHDVNLPYYYRYCVIVYFVCELILGVLA